MGRIGAYLYGNTYRTHDGCLPVELSRLSVKYFPAKDLIPPAKTAMPPQPQETRSSE